MLRLGSSRGAEGDTPRGPAPAMQERSFGRTAVPFSLPITLATFTGHSRNRPSEGGDSTNTAGEQGFVRLSGRKLPSVFQHGGDGFDAPGPSQYPHGPVPAHGNDPHSSVALSDTSFYRDSAGYYGGAGSSSPSPQPRGWNRDSGVPVTRPSPARTPVISEGAFEPPTPTPATMPMPMSPFADRWEADMPEAQMPPRRPDLGGRNQSSRDGVGSRGSKFVEDV
jgi:hypothetical protein